MAQMPRAFGLASPKRLRARLAAALVAAGLLGAAVHAALTGWLLPPLLDWLARVLPREIEPPRPGPLPALIASALLLTPFALWLAAAVAAPIARVLRALESAVTGYHDGDFSVSLKASADDDFAELIRLHNTLGDTLREQRRQLAERELLLDTVVEHTPVALLLIDDRGRIAHANLSARRLLGEGRRLQGGDFDALLARAPGALRQAVSRGEDALFDVELEGATETFHLSKRGVWLQGRMHRLLLLRHMTRELSRQEVATWKRVIRVISHELNNSLAPISSLAHSGAELLRRGDAGRLAEVLAAIGERARHLRDFLEGYARFARLPAPQPAAVAWRPFLERLAAHSEFRIAGGLPECDGWFDEAQLEQALINLLKNANEAGGDQHDVALAVERVTGEWRIEVADRGTGMSEAVLSQARLPFHSTKRSGSGLGLALAREIAEAHGGRLSLANRRGGGLRVTLTLPIVASPGDAPSI